MINNILGVLILVADVWAILSIAQSGASTGTKAVWIVVVILLPLLGLILWFLLGPKSATR